MAGSSISRVVIKRVSEEDSGELINDQTINNTSNQQSTQTTNNTQNTPSTSASSNNVTSNSNIELDGNVVIVNNAKDDLYALYIKGRIYFDILTSEEFDSIQTDSSAFYTICDTGNNFRVSKGSSNPITYNSSYIKNYYKFFANSEEEFETFIINHSYYGGYSDSQKELINTCSLNNFIQLINSSTYKIYIKQNPDDESLIYLYLRIDTKCIIRIQLKFERYYTFNAITAVNNKYNSYKNDNINVLFENQNTDNNNIIKYTDVKNFLWFSIDTFDEIQSIIIKRKENGTENWHERILVGTQSQVNNLNGNLKVILYDTNVTEKKKCKVCGTIYDKNEIQCAECGSFEYDIINDDTIKSTNNQYGVSLKRGETNASKLTPNYGYDGSGKFILLNQISDDNYSDGPADFYYGKETYYKRNLYIIKCYLPSLFQSSHLHEGAIGYENNIQVFIKFQDKKDISNNAFKAYSNSNCKLEYINTKYQLYDPYEITENSDNLIAVFRLNQGETGFNGNISVFYGNQIVYGEKLGDSGTGNNIIEPLKLDGKPYDKTSLYYSFNIIDDLLCIYIYPVEKETEIIEGQQVPKKFKLNKFVYIYINNYTSNVISTSEINSHYISQDTITLHSIDVSTPQFTKGDKVVLVDDYIHGKTKHYTNYTMLPNTNGTYSYYGIRAYAKRDGLNQLYFNDSLYDFGINGLSYNVDAKIVKLNLKKEQQTIYSFQNGFETVILKKAAAKCMIDNDNVFTFKELLNNTFTMSYEYIVDDIIPNTSDNYNLKFYTTYANVGLSAISDFNSINNPEKNIKYSVEYTYTYQCAPYFADLNVTHNVYMNDTEGNIYEYKFNDYSNLPINSNNIYKEVIEYKHISANSITLEQFKSIVLDAEQNTNITSGENKFYKYSPTAKSYLEYKYRNIKDLKEVPLDLYVKNIYYLKTNDETIPEGEKRYYINYSYIDINSDNINVKNLIRDGKYYQKIFIESINGADKNTYVHVDGFKNDGSINYYGFKLVPFVTKPKITNVGIVEHKLNEILGKALNKNDFFDIWVNQDYKLLKSSESTYKNGIFLTRSEVSNLKTKGVELYVFDSGIEYLDIDENQTIYDIDINGDTIYSSSEDLQSIISLKEIISKLNDIDYQNPDTKLENILKNNNSPYILKFFEVGGRKLKYKVNFKGKYNKINYDSIEYLEIDKTYFAKIQLYIKENSFYKLSNDIINELKEAEPNLHVISKILEYNISNVLFVPIFSKLNTSDLNNSRYIQEVLISGNNYYFFRIINDKIYPVYTDSNKPEHYGLIYCNRNNILDIAQLSIIDESKLYKKTNDIYTCINKKYFKSKTENVIHNKLEGNTLNNIEVDNVGLDSTIRYYSPRGGYDDLDLFTGKLTKEDKIWITENTTSLLHNIKFIGSDDINNDAYYLKCEYKETDDSTPIILYFHKVKFGPFIKWIKNENLNNLIGSEIAAYHHNNNRNVINTSTINDHIFDFNFDTLSLYEYKIINYTLSDEFVNLEAINKTIENEDNENPRQINSQKVWKENIKNGLSTYTDDILFKTNFFYSSYTFNDGIHIDANGSYYSNIMIFDGNQGKISKKMLLNNHTIDITKYSYNIEKSNDVEVLYDESLKKLTPFEYNKYYITWVADGVENKEYLNVNSLSPAYYANSNSYSLYITNHISYEYDYNNIGDLQLAYDSNPIVLNVNDNFYGIVFNHSIYSSDNSHINTYATTFTFDEATIEKQKSFVNIVTTEVEETESTPAATLYYVDKYEGKDLSNIIENSELLTSVNNELLYNYNNFDIDSLYTVNTYWDPSDYYYEIVELSTFAFKNYDADNSIIQSKAISTYSIETSKPFTISNSEVVNFTGTYSWIPPEYETKILSDGSKHIVISRDGYWKKDYTIEEKPFVIASYNYYPKDEISSVNITYNFIPNSYVVTAEIRHPKISYDYLVNDLTEEVKYSYLLNGFEYEYSDTSNITYENGTYYGSIKLLDIDGTFVTTKVNLYKKNTIVSKTSVKEVVKQEEYTSYEYFAYKESTPLTNEKKPVLYKTELIPASKHEVQYWNESKNSYSIKMMYDSYAYYAYYYTYETVPFQVASYVYLDELNIVGFDALTNTVDSIGYNISTEVNKQSYSFDKMTTDLSYIFNTLVAQEKILADEESYTLSTYASAIDQSLKDFAYNSNNTLSKFAYDLGNDITNLTDTENAAINKLEENVVAQLTESNNITKTSFTELSDIVKNKVESLETTLHTDLIGENSAQEVETKYVSTTYKPIINPFSGLVMGYTVSKNEGSDTIKIGGDSLGEIIQSTLGSTTTHTTRTDNPDGSYTLATYTGFIGIAGILSDLKISNKIPNYNEFMVDLVPKMYAAIDFEGDYDVQRDVEGNVIGSTKRNPSDMAKKCIMRAETLWKELRKKGIVS